MTVFSSCASSLLSSPFFRFACSASICVCLCLHTQCSSRRGVGRAREFLTGPYVPATFQRVKGARLGEADPHLSGCLGKAFGPIVHNASRYARTKMQQQEQEQQQQHHQDQIDVLVFSYVLLRTGPTFRYVPPGPVVFAKTSRARHLAGT